MVSLLLAGDLEECPRIGSIAMGLDMGKEELLLEMFRLIVVDVY
jgi:hypothetical protein